jgi:transcription antitermination factor NusG
VDEICAPTRTSIEPKRGRTVTVPWLGPLALAKWDGSDPFIWHDIKGIAGVIGIIGGWPPASVPDAQVARFLNSIEGFGKEPAVEEKALCAVGDLPTFSFGPFYRATGRCTWIDKGILGIQVHILGRDNHNCTVFGHRE